MQEYVFNFIYWWYGIVVRRYWQSTFLRYAFYLNKTDTIPMAQNFFVPLFGVKGTSNRIMGFFIRFWWVIIGSIVSTVIIIPFILAGVFLTLLPFIPFILIMIVISQ